jgi:hypothetical protein
VLGPAEGKDVQGKVNVVLLGEADVRALSLTEKGGRAQGVVDYYMTIVGRDRPERAAQQQQLELSLDPPRRAALVQHGLPMLREFKLSPGIYQSRLVTRDGRSGRIGSVTHDFEVPAAGGLRLTTPVITDALDSSGGAPRPVLLARRTFTAGGPVLAQFEVFGARSQAGQPRVVSGFTLAGPGGRVLARMEPTPIVPSADGTLSRLLKLPVAEPGEYVLTLTVQDEVSGERLEDVESFRVETAR